jgi:hypothetical protein
LLSVIGHLFSTCSSGVARALYPVEIGIQQDRCDCGEHNPRIQQWLQTFRPRD